MERKDERRQVKNNDQGPGVDVDITIYTDPLCCWSWAMSPQWDRLRTEMALTDDHFTYKMGGLLPSWDHFDDNINSIRKPVQMGPEWLHAKAICGRPIYDKIWITDPPASSFPACIAVKCVELQSRSLAMRYFNQLQEAVMVRGENIAKSGILLERAINLSLNQPSFDFGKFRDDLFGEAGKAAFRSDLQECRYLNITRFPTILFRAAGKKSAFLSGYQSFESLEKSLLRIAL